MAPLLTADEFLAIPHPDDVRRELVRGRLHERPHERPLGGGWYGTVAGNLYGALGAFVRANRLGRCFFGGTGFLLPIPPASHGCGPDGRARDTVRSPETAFIRGPRIPAGGFGPGWIPFAPDLAALVLSPGETASDTMERLADYRAAGTELLWVVDPATRIVTVHAADAPTRWLREGDVLDGGPVIPGFTLAVEALFERVAPSE